MSGSSVRSKRRQVQPLQGEPLPPPELGIGRPQSPTGGGSRKRAEEHQAPGGAEPSMGESTRSTPKSEPPDSEPPNSLFHPGEWGACPLLLGHGRTLV